MDIDWYITGSNLGYFNIIRSAVETDALNSVKICSLENKKKEKNFYL